VITSNRLDADQTNGVPEIRFFVDSVAVANGRNDHGTAPGGRGGRSAIRPDPQHFVDGYQPPCPIALEPDNPFAGDLRRRHIDEFLQGDQPADHADISARITAWEEGAGCIKSISRMRGAT